MRVIEQLIEHLTEAGHLTPGQLVQLGRKGLLRDEATDPYRDCQDDENLWLPGKDDPALTDPDGLDDYADRQFADSRRVATRRRGGPNAAECEMLAAIEQSIIQERGFLDLVLEVARRIDPTVGTDDAARLVGSADAAALCVVLARDGLWARLWPHIQREPVVSALDERAQRRFCGLLAAQAGTRHWLLTNRVTRRAVDVVNVHRALSGAFGRVALAIDRRRAFAELNLCVDTMAYEVLVILFSALTPRRTIADLPHLGAQVGLPTYSWLPAHPFDAGWPIAARIDPVAVPPFMKWCLTAWAAAPDRRTVTSPGLAVDGVEFIGAAIPRHPSQWFGLRVMDGKWVGLRHIRHFGAKSGEPTQSIIRDGVRYQHHGALGADATSDLCFRGDRSDGITARWSIHQVEFGDLRLARANYASMWAAGLFDLPMLTCPKEWELK
jgi:hypothetical protein